MIEFYLLNESKKRFFDIINYFCIIVSFLLSFFYIKLEL